MRNPKIPFHYLNFLLLVLASTFCFSLLSFRYYHSSQITYLFLVWNLFLAWVPYWLTIFWLAIPRIQSSKLGMSTLFVSWLLFLPNAPYILTDLFHLHPRYSVPLWYDMILIVSFAGTGLLLGFLSLYHWHRLVSKLGGETTGVFFAMVCLVLSSYGVYLGRYLRWNSWDMFTHPDILLVELAQQWLSPWAHTSMYKVIIVFSAFQILAYFTLYFLIRQSPEKNGYSGHTSPSV